MKENIKEINIKKCYDAVKYIKPKEFNFIGKDKTEVGFIAQDITNSKITEKWDNLIMKDNDEKYLRLNYMKMNIVLWGAVQELMKEVNDLKNEVKKLKGKGEGKKQSKKKSK